MRVVGIVAGMLLLAGVVLMFVTGMVLYGVLLVALTFAGWIVAAGLAVARDRRSLAGSALTVVPFVAAAFLVGVIVCAVAGLFAAHTDAYIWARGQEVRLEVPTIGPGSSLSGGEGMCDQVGSAVGGGEWSCGLSWQAGGTTVDGTAYITDDDKNGHADTIPARALGSSAVSARLGPSRATSQVVLGDIPWWTIPAAFGALVVLGVGGLVVSARRTR
jgi:hypothetical protein